MEVSLEAVDAMMNNAAAVLISEDTKDVIANVMGPLGSVLACCMFASSIPVMRKIASMGGVGEFSFFPYVVQTCNCWLWVSYAGGHGDLLWPLLCNGAGGLIAFASLVVYFAYCTGPEKKGLLKSSLLPVMVVFLAGAYVLIVGLQGEQMWIVDLCGTGCMIVNMVMYLGPCAGIGAAVKSKSTEFLPLSLGVSTFINSVPWFLYGLMISNFNVWLPNACGIVFGLIQVCVYVYLTKIEKAEPTLNSTLIENPENQRYSFSANMFAVMAPVKDGSTMRRIGSAPGSIAALGGGLTSDDALANPNIPSHQSAPISPHIASRR